MIIYFVKKVIVPHKNGMSRGPKAPDLMHANICYVMWVNMIWLEFKSVLLSSFCGEILMNSFNSFLRIKRQETSSKVKSNFSNHYFNDKDWTS